MSLVPRAAYPALSGIIYGFFPRSPVVVGSPARLDHVIVSTPLFPRALGLPTMGCVEPCDHSLLKCFIRLPARPAPAAVAAAPAAATTAPGASPHWRPQREAAYIHALATRIPAATAAAAAAASDPDTASHLILDLISHAAEAAGMGTAPRPRRPPPRPPRRPPGRGGPPPALV